MVEPTSETDHFTLSATGDSIITRPVLPYEGVSDRFDVVLSTLRESDATVTNLECVIGGGNHYATPPRKVRDRYQYVAASPIISVRSDPAMLEELIDMGINLFSTGNNHSLDYGRRGMIETIQALRERNLTFAGLGRDLPDARSPGYLQTSAGRVGMVHACTSGPHGGEAGNPSPLLPGRPGISPLHVNWTYEVSADRLDALRDIAVQVGIEDVRGSWNAREDWDLTDEDTYEFMHMAFRAVDDDANAGINLSLHPPDRTAVLEQVEEAAAQAEWVVATVHSHQGPRGSRNVPETPSFLVEFAHDCIDAGADVFVCTGPHVLRGIEIYEEKPVFYSLGNFFFQIETLAELPADSFENVGIDEDEFPSRLIDAYLVPDGELGGIFDDPEYWMTVIPTCRFDDAGRVTRIELTPCSLGRGRHRSERGTPLLATADQREWIFNELRDRSKQYGTTLERDGRLGVIQPE